MFTGAAFFVFGRMATLFILNLITKPKQHFGIPGDNDIFAALKKADSNDLL